MNFPLFPPQTSPIAAQTDRIFWVLFALCFGMVVMIFVPMIYFLFKYRRGKPANRRMPRLPTNAIEITWTIIPTFLLMGFFAWGANQYFQMERTPADAIQINVVGKQWMWKVQHPEGNREINELHVP